MLAGGGLADDSWHHLVFTYDQAAAEEGKVYVDGQLVLAEAGWGGYIDASLTSPLSFGGARPDRADPWGEFDGFIDEVQIYSRAITADEVLVLTNNPGSTLVIPEPGSLVLAIMALSGLALFGLRRRH